MLIISIVGMSAMYMVNGYLKYTYDRDTQLKAVIKNIDTLESLKESVTTLPQLCCFAQTHNLRIIAVGVGEVKLTEKVDGSIEIIQISNENYGFSESLLSDGYNLFRIEIGGDIPNSKLTTILRLDGDGNA